MTTLKTSLLSYKKTELESYAKTLGIKRISSLKKSEIAEIVADELLNAEVMAKRLAILDDAQIALFEKAAKGAFMATEAEMDTAYEACALDYMQVSEEGMLEVTEDVAEAYEKMDQETFEKKRKEVSWLAKCLSFSAAMYGVAPVDTVRTVYESRPHYHADKETFMALFDEIPYEINPCVISEDVIMDRKLIAGDAYEALLNEQQGKKFYVPSWQQVEEFAANGCLLDEASYKKLFAFFQKEFELGYEEAVAVTADIWNHLSTGHGDVYGKLQEVIEKYHFQSKEGVRTFSTLLQGVVNSTRMIIHRGHTPNEITVKRQKNNLPNFRTAQPKKNQKIYPNDVCPCGSGKKYKKCCGRN